jgi:predicted phosphoribosyltransferase
MLFHNRVQAGEKLALELRSLGLPDPFVLAIPRGGVPVGSAVAKALGSPFDVIPLIKIPIPWSPEASYGTIAVDGTMALNMPLIHRLELSERETEMAARKVLQEVERRAHLYRNDKPFPSLEQKSVIIIDDGLGSGYSMLAAVDFVKKRNPRVITAASPIASDMAFRMLAAKPQIDTLLALVRDREQVFSLSSHYKEFKPLTDDEVVRCLSTAACA